MTKYTKGQTVYYKGRNVVIVEVIDKFDDDELSFKLEHPLYDVEWMNGQHGAIASEDELSNG
jgi:hypothetical protein